MNTTQVTPQHRRQSLRRKALCLRLSGFRCLILPAADTKKDDLVSSPRRTVIVKMITLRPTATIRDLTPHQSAFKKILRDLQKTYKIISLPPTTLPLPFTSFHSKFLSSSSPFSFPKFHENLEDKNVESTEWTDGPSMSRVMKFLHPIGKNPVGPSETR